MERSVADAKAGPPVFVTGGTGYLGRSLIAALVARGTHVRALARSGSERKLPAGCHAILGDALEGSSYAEAVCKGDVFVHLVGVAHPSPRKKHQFRSVDLASVEAATRVARTRQASRFVYVSVAQPAPIMRAYVDARKAGEDLVRATGLPASILRPWYVLGPGHWWPLLLLPVYAVAAVVPGWRSTCRRLGLVTRRQMLRALVRSVDATDNGPNVVEVPQIRHA